MLYEIISELSPLAVTMTAVISAVTVTALYYWLKDRGVPPGPTGIPYIGYWPFLRKADMSEHMTELSKIYGDLYSIRITGQLYIHLGSHKALREVHVDKTEYLTARYEAYSVMRHCFDASVGFVREDKWKVLRKIFTQKLRPSGLLAMTDNIRPSLVEAVVKTVEILKSKEGQLVDLQTILLDPCTDTVRQLTFCGDHVSDEQMRELIVRYFDLHIAMTSIDFLLTGPLCKYLLFPLRPEYRKMVRSCKRMLSLLEEIIKEHESTLDEDHPRNIIDAYLIERNARILKKDPTAKYFTYDALTYTLNQIVGDGSYSVAVFVAMFIQIFAKRQNLQEAIYKEICEVLGDEVDPSYEHRNRLPYTTAAMYEIYRNGFSIPIPGLQFERETTVRGYRIPKDAVTIVNPDAIHKDPEAHRDPEKFDPTRFIEAPGKPREKYPVNFGASKRSCMGEAYTFMHIFVFTTNIIKRFHLSVPENTSDNFMEFNFKVYARLRNPE